MQMVTVSNREGRWKSDGCFLAQTCNTDLYYKILYFSIYRMWNSAVPPVINCFNLYWNDFCLPLQKPAAFRIWVPWDRDHCKYIWCTMHFLPIQQKGHSNNTIGVLGFVNLLTPAMRTIVEETSPDLDWIRNLVLNCLHLKTVFKRNHSCKSCCYQHKGNAKSQHGGWL